MRITERQLERILADRNYWRATWLEIVAESARENTQKLLAREAAHGPGSVTSSRVPQPDADSQIGRASSLPLSEFQQHVRDAMEDSTDKLKDHPGQSCNTAHPGISHQDYVEQNDDKEEMEEERKRGLFDARYQVTSILPRSRLDKAGPDNSRLQRLDPAVSHHGPSPTDPDAKLLVESWNRYRQPAEPRMRKIVVRKNLREVRE